MDVGATGVELVTSDAHPGLKNAIAVVFAGAGWQRCRTHFMANLLTRVPKRALLSCRRAGVATNGHTIYQQRSRVINAERPKFGNRQPPDRAARPSGHLAVSVRVELLAC